MEKLTLPWLRPLWKQLVLAHRQGRLSHAPAIPWQTGLGSDRIIMTLAQWLLCQESASSPCGHCKSCLLWKAQTHPDFLHIAPVDNKRIGVDVVRQIQHLIQQKSAQRGNKVVVVQQAEQLTVAAANALLKTLEEPSADTYVIMAPERYSRLLPTVRSRISQYDVPKPDIEMVRSWIYHYAQVNLVDTASLERASMQPLKVLEELKGGSEDPPAGFWDLIYNPGLSLPNDLTSAHAWLDKAIDELRTEHRAALGFRGGQPVYSASAQQLSDWSVQACKIKQQLQQSGLNLTAILQPWISQIRKELSD